VFAFFFTAIFILPIMFFVASKNFGLDSATRVYISVGIIIALKLGFIAFVFLDKNNFPNDHKEKEE